MGPPSYMLSVVDRNVVMRRIPVFYEDCYEPWDSIIAWYILLKSCILLERFSVTICYFDIPFY
jgi:hypothetical protein